MSERCYENPVVRGFFPDPSVIRVGGDYYLVNSTFQYFPAIPIQHSKDLVHWEIIGHAITDNDYLDLSNLADSHGIWAPDISYYNGTYYIFAPLRLNNADENDSGRLRQQLIMKSDKPEGPYSKPVILNVDSIDPSHFIDDDGTHYLVTAPGATVTMLNDDCTNIVKPPVCVWRGSVRAPEGPHIMKKDGYYYAIIAAGGTGYGHRINVARSKNIYGPYEECPYNPVMTQTDPNAPIQRAGHGKLVQTQNGDWWAMYLCARPNGGNYTTLGRETALDPVTWTEDGWFVINNLKGPSTRQKAPALPEVMYDSHETDDFDSGLLSPYWEFVRNPHYDNFSLIERCGWLRLKGCEFDLSERKSYNTLVRRESEFAYEASVKLEYSPVKNGHEAGLTCYYGIYNYLKLCKCYDDGAKVKVIENRNGNIKTLGVFDISDSPSSIIYLKIKTNGQRRLFYYSFDNESWNLTAMENDCTFLCDEGVETGKHHTGTMVGMYACNPDKTPVNADFDWFNIHFEKE